MLDKLKDFLGDLIPGDDKSTQTKPLVIDKKLSAAALMMHAIVADGKVKPEEQAKMLSVLQTHYDLTSEEAAELVDDAGKAQMESIDLYAFTSVLKAQMSETERMGMVEDLWEMVYADGELHEFEDNLVWRVAELIGISSDRRMALKRAVRDRSVGAQ